MPPSVASLVRRAAPPRPRRSLADGPLWAGMLAAVAVFAVGIVTRTPGELSPFLDVVVYNVVYVTGAALCWRTHATDRREVQAWRLIGAALGVNVTANIYFILVISPAADPPYPSLADVLYLSTYPLLYAGVVLLARARVRRFQASMWLDGVVGGLGAAAIVLGTVLGPVLRVSDGELSAVLTNLAYPVADLLLLVLLFGTSSLLGLRADRALLLMGAALIFNLTGDIGFMLQDSAGTYTEGGVLDLMWLLAVVATAWGACTRRQAASGPRDGDGARIGWYSRCPAQRTRRAWPCWPRAGGTGSRWAPGCARSAAPWPRPYARS